MISNGIVRRSRDRNERMTKYLLPMPGYAIGPLADSDLTTIEVCVDEQTTVAMSIPVVLPAEWSSDLGFLGGCAYGYSDGDFEDLTSPMAVVNGVYNTLRNDLVSADARLEGEKFTIWAFGWIVGDLACLATNNPQLAAVGLAHFCYLLSLLPVYPEYHASAFSWAACGHMQALGNYRTNLRTFTNQGYDLVTAYDLAYQGNARDQQDRCPSWPVAQHQSTHMGGYAHA